MDIASRGFQSLFPRKYGNKWIIQCTSLGHHKWCTCIYDGSLKNSAINIKQIWAHWFSAPRNNEILNKAIFLFGHLFPLKSTKFFVFNPPITFHYRCPSRPKLGMLWTIQWDDRRQHQRSPTPFPPHRKLSFSMDIPPIEYTASVGSSETLTSKGRKSKWRDDMLTQQVQEPFYFY